LASASALTRSTAALPSPCWLLFPLHIQQPCFHFNIVCCQFSSHCFFHLPNHIGNFTTIHKKIVFHKFDPVNPIINFMYAMPLFFQPRHCTLYSTLCIRRHRCPHR